MKASVPQILVCAQTAMLDNVVHELRQATVEPYEHEAILHVEYGGEKTELKDELIEFATSQFTPNTGEGMGASFVYSDHEALTELRGYPIYRRFESESRTFSECRSEDQLLFINSLDLSRFRYPFEARARLAAQRALLDCVHRDLRSVTVGVEEEQKNVVLFATYASEPDTLRNQLITHTAEKLRFLLPSANKVSTCICVLSESEGRTKTPGTFAFARYEGWLTRYGDAR